MIELRKKIVKLKKQKTDINTKLRFTCEKDLEVTLFPFPYFLSQLEKTREIHS